MLMDLVDGGRVVNGDCNGSEEKKKKKMMRLLGSMEENGDGF